MKIELNREKELETILTLCVALVVFFFLTHQQHKWMLLASIVLGVIGMFSKFLTAKIAWAWMKLAEVMGNVNSRIILTSDDVTSNNQLFLLVRMHSFLVFVL